MSGWLQGLIVGGIVCWAVVFFLRRTARSLKGEPECDGCPGDGSCDGVDRDNPCPEPRSGGD